MEQDTIIQSLIGSFKVPNLASAQHQSTTFPLLAKEILSSVVISYEPFRSFFSFVSLYSHTLPPAPLHPQQTQLQVKSGQRGVCVLPHVGRAGRVALVSVCPPPTALSVVAHCVNRDLATTLLFVQVSPQPILTPTATFLSTHTFSWTLPDPY